MFILCDGSGARPDETDLGQILALDLSSHQVLRRFLGLAGEDRRQMVTLMTVQVPERKRLAQQEARIQEALAKRPETSFSFRIIFGETKYHNNLLISINKYPAITHNND